MNKLKIMQAVMTLMYNFQCWYLGYIKPDYKQNKTKFVRIKLYAGNNIQA